MHPIVQIVAYFESTVLVVITAFTIGFLFGAQREIDTANKNSHLSTFERPLCPVHHSDEIF